MCAFTLIDTWEARIAIAPIFPFRRARPQVGALPYRITASGELEVLLITSRQSRRWVIPKGNLMPDRSWPDAAAQEAFEEAGIIGEVRKDPIGRYRYLKQRRFGLRRPCIVTVLPLAVEQQLDDWPEKTQRDLRWASTEVAARLLRDRTLGRLIARFSLARLRPERRQAWLWRTWLEPDPALRSFARHGRHSPSQPLRRRPGDPL
ncbi:NUDIX hydrolase [Sphingomonas oryzagri]